MMPWINSSFNWIYMNIKSFLSIDLRHPSLDPVVRSSSWGGGSFQWGGWRASFSAPCPDAGGHLQGRASQEAVRYPAPHRWADSSRRISPARGLWTHCADHGLHGAKAYARATGLPEATVGRGSAGTTASCQTGPHTQVRRSLDRSCVVSRQRSGQHARGVQSMGLSLAPKSLAELMEFSLNLWQQNFSRLNRHSHHSCTKYPMPTLNT